jgi:hypothetical protein
MEKLINNNEHDEFCSAFLNLSLATGTTFPLIRYLILDEFKKNAKDDPGSIMRGNCMASKVTKAYLSILFYTLFTVT